MPTDQPTDPDTRDEARAVRDELTEALRVLQLDSVRVRIGDLPSGSVLLSLALDPASAARLTAHLAPAAHLRPFPGTVLWHQGHEAIVTVHRVLTPVRLAIRSQDLLQGVPFMTHIRELRLPTRAELA
jgi:hypothetical protein